MWHDWREAAYRRIREQHFMDAFDAESRDDLARWIADAVIEAWPEREQPRGAVKAALDSADLLADAIFEGITQRTLESLASEYRVARQRAEGQ
jgi:hypothetical protein